MDKAELESRLIGWANEYGGGKYQNVGWQGVNLLQTLIEHRGFIPSSRGYIPVAIKTAGDEVEKIVRAMELGDMLKIAKVLRCDYFLPNFSVDDRLKSMRKIGFSMSRAGYYDILAQGKMYLRGALTRKEAA